MQIYSPASMSFIKMSFTEFLILIKTPREILLAFYTAAFMCQFYKKSAYRSIIAYFAIKTHKKTAVYRG